MRRGPRWEAEAAREERRTLRLAASVVPLTIAERRLLELLVDEPDSEQELRETCGYRETHPLRVLLRRLIRSGHAAEGVGNRFTITKLGGAALRGSRPPTEGQARPRVDLRYLTQCEHRLLRALASLPDGTPMMGADVRATARLSSPGFYHAVYRLLGAGCIEQLTQFPMSLVIMTRGREALEQTQVRGDHAWDLRHGHSDLLRQAPRRHTRLHFDVVPPPFRSAVIAYLIAYLEVMVAKGRKMDTLRGMITACASPLQRYVERHPGATDLCDLDADDIDAYLTDRAHGPDGAVDERLARRAQAEARCYVRFLEERRDVGDPLIPAGFSIYPLRRRIALPRGHVLFRNTVAAEQGTVQAAPADVEAAFASDRWDVRTIPGLRCQDTWQTFVVDFSRVPLPFREDVKGYIRMTLTAKNHTAGYALRETQVLQAFLTFVGERHPGIGNLRDLTAADILAWVQKLQSETNRRGNPRSRWDIAYYVGASQRFARHLQRIESQVAPTRKLEKVFPRSLFPQVGKAGTVTVSSTFPRL